MQDAKTGGSRWVPDIREDEITEFQEQNGDETATYKAVNVHPIISRVLDKLAFFRTHVSAVWYNKLANKTVKDKLDEIDTSINSLNSTGSGTTMLMQSQRVPKSFRNLKVYGKSTQDGTPSPESPAPIVSAGDEGEINISVSDGGTQLQTLTISTPNGLPGIPVSSGGNYTDADGQQWVCDEIDLARGKYVQRVGTHLIRAVNDISNERQQNPDYFGCVSPLLPDGIGYNKKLMSDKLVFVGIDKNIDGSEITIVPSNGYMVFGLKKSVVSEETVRAVTNYLSENPITILYASKEPIETDLSAEEMEAYKALKTYTPTTVISSDSGVWMEADLVDSDILYPHAENISYDNSTSSLTADNVQEAIDENAAAIGALNSSMNVTDVQIEETITLSTNRVKKSGNVISGSVGFTKSTTGWVTIGTIAAAPFAQYDFPLIRNNDGLHIGVLRISENGTISAYSADAAGDVSASFSYISIMT